MEALYFLMNIFMKVMIGFDFLYLFTEVVYCPNISGSAYLLIIILFVIYFISISSQLLHLTFWLAFISYDSAPFIIIRYLLLISSYEFEIIKWVIFYPIHGINLHYFIICIFILLSLKFG